VIDCFDYATSHLFGDALASQFRLRHRVFIDRTNYQVPTWREMEYDQYDTPAATYLVWRDEEGVARGVARLSPTDRPYMLKDVWPEMVETIPLPSSPTIWEGTRFGVDKDLQPELRKRIVAELVAGYMEFCVEAGVRGIIGVMPTLIWRAVFSSNGWPVQFLGSPQVLGGDKCVAGLLGVTPEITARVRAKTDCGPNILNHGQLTVLHAA
jgi:acyl homoserine lactone synthase